MIETSNEYFYRIERAYKNFRGDSIALFQTILTESIEIGFDRALAYLEQCVLEKHMAWCDQKLTTLAMTGNPLIDGHRIFYQEYLGAATPGDDIRVAQGLYQDISVRDGFTQVVYITKSVSIYGGYSPIDWENPDPLVRQMILDAKGQGRVIHIEDNNPVHIEGFYIMGGNASGQGGDAWGGDAGGGIYIDNAPTVISFCVVYSNSAFRGCSSMLQISN
ncbi:MAG: hypothetical protein JXA42_21550 [Anaerolineales bacterium]|nr:hypothetical protein [Anaerolineales bacterium]